MSHERYPLEERTSNPFQNEEWRQFSGIEYRYPNQFGEALLVEGVNCMPEEAAELKARGAIFPLETAEPSRVRFVSEVDSQKLFDEVEIFGSRGESIGFDIKAK